MNLEETELDNELYLLVDTDGKFRRWTPKLGAARMMQLAEDLEPLRFRFDPMSEKAWETIDVDEHATLEEYTNADN